RILGRGGGAVISAVGEDEFGRRLLRGLQEEGVDVRGVFVMEEEPSGRAFVVVDEATGENLIISFHGALLRLGREHVDLAEVRDAVESSRIVVVMDVPTGFMEGLVDAALEADRTVLLAPGIKASENPEMVRSLLRKVDYVVLNEGELAELAGPGDPIAGARALAREGAKVVVTLSGRGAIIAGSGELIEQPALDLQRMGLKAVNTVGCGDAFIGVFAAFKSAGSGDAEALRRANVAGAYKATRLEVRGSPTLEQLLRFEEAARGAGALVEPG
ncbi:MAG: carbohydrate kinase family protein, partial [Conexivisphaera sp.]